jgi:hypothetical protein
MLFVMEGRVVRVGWALAEVAVAGVLLVVRTVGVGAPELPNPKNFAVPFPSAVSGPGAQSSDGGGPTGTDPWMVDDCVTARPQRDPVDCAQTHVGVITARVSAMSLCPAGTDHYRQIPSTKQIACIDEM